jgi:hypothetical protein
MKQDLLAAGGAEVHASAGHVRLTLTSDFDDHERRVGRSANLVIEAVIARCIPQIDEPSVAKYVG